MCCNSAARRKRRAAVWGVTASILYNLRERLGRVAEDSGT